MDSSLHLVPGPCKAAHCSWGVLEEGRSRMGKKQKINSPRPQACVCLCVCVLCRLHKIHVCVVQCVACGNKKLTKVSLVCLFVYNTILYIQKLLKKTSIKYIISYFLWYFCHMQRLLLGKMYLVVQCQVTI